jgi:hypothetical protein
MSLLSVLKSLFSASPESQPIEETVEYKGFNIIPAPINENGQYRVAATITKGEGEFAKQHNFIRSDLIPSRDECLQVTLRKTKMTIDQLGDNLFN